MKSDGTQEEKVVSKPIAYLRGISPDGRFVVVDRAVSREENWRNIDAVPVAGGPSIPLCSGWCDVNWSRDGKLMYFYWGYIYGQSTNVCGSEHSGQRSAETSQFRISIRERATCSGDAGA